MSFESPQSLEGVLAQDAAYIAVRSLQAFVEVAKSKVQEPKRRGDRIVYVVKDDLKGQIDQYLTPETLSVHLNRYSRNITSATLGILANRDIAMPEGYHIGGPPNQFFIRLGMGYKHAALRQVFMTSWVMPLQELAKRESEVTSGGNEYLARKQYELFEAGFFETDATGVPRGAANRMSSTLKGDRHLSSEEKIKLQWMLTAINIAKSCIQTKQ